MEILAAVDETRQRRIKTCRSSVLMKNEELEQDLGRGDKRDLRQLLHAARKENDTLEEKLAGLQEQLSRSQAEVRHLKAQLANVTKKSKTEIEDLKNEALTARAQLILDNKAQKDTIRSLEEWIDKLTKQQQQQNEARQSVLGTVNQEMAPRHQLATFSRQDSGLSVKSLIQSIEKNKKTEKPILIAVNQEMASRHKLATCSRQDSGLSVKSSIKGIKNNEQTEKPILSTINQEEASTHKLATFSRQDSGLSVKSLIQSINKKKQSDILVLSTAEQEMASRRRRMDSFSRQDSRLSVKSLIEILENNMKELNGCRNRVIVHPRT
uniref:Uncharacterized protein n=1 Tax=Glossina palpalis gambiensis TaxID=67801 RepID=A0A1B0B198_9MUSC